jgi:hypothetical protein
MSVKATAQDRVKYLLTIKRNERSPSSEIPAHHHRNAHKCASKRHRKIDVIRKRPANRGRP